MDRFAAVLHDDANGRRSRDACRAAQRIATLSWPAGANCHALQNTSYVYNDFRK